MYKFPGSSLFYIKGNKNEKILAKYKTTKIKNAPVLLFTGNVSFSLFFLLERFYVWSWNFKGYNTIDYTTFFLLNFSFWVGFPTIIQLHDYLLPASRDHHSIALFTRTKTITSQLLSEPIKLLLCMIDIYTLNSPCAWHGCRFMVIRMRRRTSLIWPFILDKHNLCNFDWFAKHTARFFTTAFHKNKHHTAQPPQNRA